MADDSISEAVRSITRAHILSQNSMREMMGLEPRPFIHTYYHIDGVTDLSVFRKQAEKRKTQEGKPSWIHLHREGEGCRKGCTLINEKKEEGGDDGG